MAFGNFPCVSLRILFWCKSGGIIGHFMSRKVIISSFFFAMICTKKLLRNTYKSREPKGVVTLLLFLSKIFFIGVTLLYKKNERKYLLHVFI